MQITPVALLFAMLGVASARVGETVNASDQDETRNLQKTVIEIPVNILTKTNVTPGGGGGTLGGPNDNVRVMVGYKNEQGKLAAIATEATGSELITEFKTVNVLTMTIPSVLLATLANDPNIE
jgi:opacity protein-like surface antigen